MVRVFLFLGLLAMLFASAQLVAGLAIGIPIGVGIVAIMLIAMFCFA